MRILVTGAAGFLGANTVDSLFQAGHQIRCLVHRLPARGLLPEGVEVFLGDVADPAAVRHAARGVDAAINLAGRLYSPGVPTEVYYSTHVLGIRNLLEACSQNGDCQSIIHCSTTGVLGETGGIAAREDALPRPTNDYERTKLEGEILARRLSDELDLPLTILRPGLVYGPYDLHLLGLFKTVKYHLFRLIGSGNNHFHPIFVDDFVSAVHLCLSANRARGEAYHIAGERPATVREFVSEIAASMGTSIHKAPLPVPMARWIGLAFELIPGIPKSRLPLTRSRVDFLLSDRTYSIAKAREELGFEPKTRLADGIRLTTRWYRTNGYL